MSVWDERLPRLREMARAGYSTEQMAEELGSTVAAVQKACQRNNISLHKPAKDVTKLKAGIVHHVPLRQLRIDPNQPRYQVNNETLRTLAESLKTEGQESPIKARLATDEDGEGAPLIVVHGERRLRAAELAGMQTIEVLLDDRDDGEVARVLRQISDNYQREELTTYDWMRTLLSLKEDHGMTPEQIAQHLAERGISGFSRPVVSNYLRLFQLPKAAQALITGGWMTPSHGKYLLGIKSDLVRDALIQGLQERHDAGDPTCNVNVIPHNAIYHYERLHIDLKAAAFDPATNCKSCPNFHVINLGKGQSRPFCTDKPCFDAKQAAATAEPQPKAPAKAEPQTGEADPLYPQAVDWVLNGRNADGHDLAFRFGIKRPRATAMLEAMERQGIIGPRPEKGEKREILQPKPGKGEAAEPLGAEDDPLYERAVSVTKGIANINISRLQHDLAIGYNRAARLIDELQRQGVIGSFNVSTGMHPVLFADRTAEGGQEEEAPADIQGGTGQPPSQPQQPEPLTHKERVNQVAPVARKATRDQHLAIAGLAAFGEEANGESTAMTLQQIQKRIAKDPDGFLAALAARSVDFLVRSELEEIAAMLGMETVSWETTNPDLFDKDAA